MNQNIFGQIKFLKLYFIFWYEITSTNYIKRFNYYSNRFKL